MIIEKLFSQLDIIFCDIIDRRIVEIFWARFAKLKPLPLDATFHSFQNCLYWHFRSDFLPILDWFNNI